MMRSPRTPRPYRKAIQRMMRDRVFARDHHRCVYCGKGRADGITLTVDHVVPKSLGGDRHSDSNLVTACHGCNTRKGARRPDQAGMTWVNGIVGQLLAAFDRQQQQARAYRRRQVGT